MKLANYETYPDQMVMITYDAMFTENTLLQINSFIQANWEADLFLKRDILIF